MEYLIIYLLAGIISWTLLEYVIHRFLGHWKHGKNEITKEHQRHHREVHYFAEPWKKALLAVVILGTSTLLLGLIAGWLEGFVFSFGLATMYLVYEALHKRAHTHAPRNWYGRWLRKHHFYHHFKNPKRNHGVTTPVWDYVFQTHAKPTKIPVPKKMVLPWLVDMKNLRLLPEFEGDYELKGSW